MDRRDEAVEFTWNLIERYTREKTDLKDYVRPAPFDCKKVKSTFGGEDHTNILCVKWGKKYGADYVNKLFIGIKKNTRKLFSFYCFTDDPAGLNPEIQVVLLKETWGGWWGKATLFSKGKFFNMFLL